jgi:hypothetical protein
MAARKSLSRCRVVIALSSVVLFSGLGSAQTMPAQNKVQLFQAYFDALATEPHTPHRGDLNGADFEQLTKTIPTMTTAELQQAVSIIDAAIVQARTSHDGIARTYAGVLLFYISGTKDGPGLMAPEISHLSALCSDPFTLTGSFTMLMLLQRQYPELTVPAMLQAIKAPDANSPAGRGPAYATILFLYPRDSDLVRDVLVYMQRPDLTGQKLLDFLNGIRASSLMPDTVVEQLTHYLNDPQPEIRLAALRDISAGGFAERERLRPVLQRLVDDPAQSDALRVLAVETLATNKLVDHNPYQ